MTNMEIKMERERMEAIGYTDVRDLCRDCLVELKQHYMAELVDEGVFGIVMFGDDSITEPSMEVLANADGYISDDFIHEYYDGMEFVPDDFFCLMETED